MSPARAPDRPVRPTVTDVRRRRRALPLLLAPLLLAGAACGERDDVVYTAERVVVYDPDQLPAPTTTLVVAGPVLIDRIWSPEPTIAEVLGTGAVPFDPITVDDGPADVVVFDVADDGSFLLRLTIPEEGAHTVCVRDACGRVFVEVDVAAD